MYSGRDLLREAATQRNGLLTFGAADLALHPALATLDQPPVEGRMDTGKVTRNPSVLLAVVADAVVVEDRRLEGDCGRSERRREGEREGN